MEEKTAPMPWPRPFTSALNRREMILVLLYIPIHLLVLQAILAGLVEKGSVTEPAADLLYYLVGFLYMVLSGFGFLRRDFDALADAPFLCIREIMRSYLLMLGCNLLLGLLLLLLPEAENPNNAHIIEVAQQDTRMMKAAVIYLAPVVEEMLFRAGIFGLLRRKSRLAAYLVSTVGFALLHVAPYAMIQPLYWFFILQYIPASLLLAHCYERTNSIWCSIFFHMLVNGVSLSALNAVG